MLISLLAAMILSGWLGCFARYFINFESAKEPALSFRDGRTGLKGSSSVFVLGTAAALVVPLFLSIGNNDIIGNILSGADRSTVAADILVVAGFCVLAGAVAPSFIENLAQRALSLARKNEEKIESLEEKTQGNLELIAEKIEGGNQASPAAATPRIAGLSVSATGDEGRVVDALNTSAYLKRTVTGIAADTGIGKDKVREILNTLVHNGDVVRTTSGKTGVVFYELVER
ncbi:YEATS-associated helix-containing protein [Mesorhizobium sp. ANAO-SY3R2]|uniref:YEATS-associated helix-containing protein n=1 Tax=Mesorhizobium sp. ANAO-SY3R2 TaxID=3166644 RepID=UPI00366D532F